MHEGLSSQARIDLGPDSLWFEQDDSPELVQLATEVRKRLLSEPYLDATTVSARLGRPDIESLISDGTLLAYKDHGEYLFPAFQFDAETHQPIEVVRRINGILGAPSDGWGVTAWWVQTNGRLGENTAPVQLLRDPDLHSTLLLLADGTANDDSY